MAAVAVTVLLGLYRPSSAAAGSDHVGRMPQHSRRLTMWRSARILCRAQPTQAGPVGMAAVWSAR